MTTITPWYLTPEALELLADCARILPVDLRFTRYYGMTREETRAYDDEDERVTALTAVRDRILTPLLNDADACRDGRVDRAGLMVHIGMAIDAVADEPICSDDTYYLAEVARVAAEIMEAMNVRRAA